MSRNEKPASPESVAAATIAAQAISDKRGEDIAVLDLSGLLIVTDVFLIASGTSTRHVKTLVDDVEDALRLHDRKPIRREGKEHGEWVLLDYGDLIVHVFDPETRAYYDLERLWADAPRIDVPVSTATPDAG